MILNRVVWTPKKIIKHSPEFCIKISGVFFLWKKIIKIIIKWKI